MIILRFPLLVATALLCGCLKSKMAPTYEDSLQMHVVLSSDNTNSENSISVECVLTPKSAWAMSVEFAVTANQTVVVPGPYCGPYMAPYGDGEFSLVWGLAPQLQGFEWDRGIGNFDGYVVLEAGETARMSGEIALDILSPSPAFKMRTAIPDSFVFRCAVSYWALSVGADKSSIAATFPEGRSYAVTAPLFMQVEGQLIGHHEKSEDMGEGD